MPHPHRFPSVRPSSLAALLLALGATAPVGAQPAVSPAQQARAQAVAEQGVPLTELAPDAPARHTVRRGDTLWDIAKLFLRSPWRWPDLWGMNLADIRNPHRIYPGQTLYLVREGDRATLSTQAPGQPSAGQDGVPPTVKLSPRTRVESASDSAVPAVARGSIEAFLTESDILSAPEIAGAARIVATPEKRLLLSQGDRAYALGGPDQPLDTSVRGWRILRPSKPIKDPANGEVLGYETQLVGKATVVSAEVPGTAGGPATVPAAIELLSAREEVRVGDRLVRETEREWPYFVPSAAPATTAGQVAAVFGNAVAYAGQNQVVTLNRGRAHGLERGHVLALLKDAGTAVDRATGQPLRLPGERNGLMMVFRTFERSSYALILQIRDGVVVGDRFATP